jgi:hypothetical protein
MATLITSVGKGAPLTPTEADGNLSLLQTRTGDGWRDNISSIDTRGGGNAPERNLYRDGIYLYEFSASQMNEVFSNFHIDHDYKLGTMLYPHFHFVTTNTGSGVVRLGFEYTFAKGHGLEAFPATTTLYRNFSVAANSQNIHFVAEMPEGQGIPGTGVDTDGVVLMRIFRDAGHTDDTFPGTVFGILADLHYEVDRYSTINRAPNFRE